MCYIGTNMLPKIRTTTEAAVYDERRVTCSTRHNSSCSMGRAHTAVFRTLYNHNRVTFVTGLAAVQPPGTRPFKSLKVNNTAMYLLTFE